MNYLFSHRQIVRATADAAAAAVVVVVITIIIFAPDELYPEV